MSSLHQYVALKNAQNSHCHFIEPNCKSSQKKLQKEQNSNTEIEGATINVYKNKLKDIKTLDMKLTRELDRLFKHYYLQDNRSRSFYNKISISTSNFSFLQNSISVDDYLKSKMDNSYFESNNKMIIFVKDYFILEPYRLRLLEKKALLEELVRTKLKAFNKAAKKNSTLEKLANNSGFYYINSVKTVTFNNSLKSVNQSVNMKESCNSNPTFSKIVSKNNTYNLIKNNKKQDSKIKELYYKFTNNEESHYDKSSASSTCSESKNNVLITNNSITDNYFGINQLHNEANNEKNDQKKVDFTSFKSNSACVYHLNSFNIESNTNLKQICSSSNPKKQKQEVFSNSSIEFLTTKAETPNNNLVLDASTAFNMCKMEGKKSSFFSNPINQSNNNTSSTLLPILVIDLEEILIKSESPIDSQKDYDFKMSKFNTGVFMIDYFYDFLEEAKKSFTLILFSNQTKELLDEVVSRLEIEHFFLLILDKSYCINVCDRFYIKDLAIFSCLTHNYDNHLKIAEAKTRSTSNTSVLDGCKDCEKNISDYIDYFSHPEISLFQNDSNLNDLNEYNYENNYNSQNKIVDIYIIDNNLLSFANNLEQGVLVNTFLGHSNSYLYNLSVANNFSVNNMNNSLFSFIDKKSNKKRKQSSCSKTVDLVEKSINMDNNLIECKDNQIRVSPKKSNKNRSISKNKNSIINYTTGKLNTDYLLSVNNQVLNRMDYKNKSNSNNNKRNLNNYILSDKSFASNQSVNSKSSNIERIYNINRINGYDGYYNNSNMNCINNNNNEEKEINKSELLCVLKLLIELRNKKKKKY